MKHPLSFHDGKFKILVFSDSQDFLPGPDPRTISCLEHMLDEEKPDLVVMNGDNCEAKGPTDPLRPTAEEEFREYARRLTLPMEERGIPWCHTFGNHDIANCPKELQERVFESFPHCLSESGPEDIPGVGNYVLPVLSSDQSGVAYAVWALDSHDNIYTTAPFAGHPETPFRYGKENINGRSDYDFIKFEQIAWYYNTSKAMEKECGGKVPGLMFFHIALPEHRLVPGNPEETGMQGECNETICNSPINSGMMAAVLQRGDVTGIFVGHDHTNDFVGTVHGVQLGFDGSLSYSTYGLPKDHPNGRNYLRGGRVFVIDEADPRHHETYMRYGREFGLR